MMKWKVCKKARGFNHAFGNPSASGKPDLRSLMKSKNLLFTKLIYSSLVVGLVVVVVVPLDSM